MPFYRQLGSIPRKRHIEHRTSPGYRDEGIFYEEVITVAGFDRAYTIAYHLRPPTRVAKVLRVTLEFINPPAPLCIILL